MGVSSVDAAFVVQFDPSQTNVQSNGMTQTITIDLLMTFNDDGSPGSLSSFTFEVADPGSGLTFANPAVADIPWDSGPSLASTAGGTSVGALNFLSPGDVTLVDGQTIRLMSLDFVVDGSVVEQSFPLALSFQDANRGIFTPISSSEFSFPAGSFEVTAVPEPATLSALGVLVGACLLRRRRNSRK